jgi:hypothetical protein
MTLEEEPEQERDRVPGARIGWLLTCALVVGTAGVLASTCMLDAHGGAPPSTERVAPRTIGSIEQTSVRAVAAGLDLREGQRRQLEGYRWLDREGGVAEIPIERAMSIVSEEAQR